MNAFFVDIKTRFAELEKRERTALFSLAGFLIVVIFYIAVWSPIQSFVIDSQLDYNRHLKLLGYFKSTESEAKAASGDSSEKTADGRSLLTTVSRMAQSVSVSPSRMQPEGGDAVSVWFDSVTFSQLMLLLERLESGKGIVVRQISIDRRDQPGLVSARVVLRN